MRQKRQGPFTDPPLRVDCTRHSKRRCCKVMPSRDVANTAENTKRKDGGRGQKESSQVPQQRSCRADRSELFSMHHSSYLMNSTHGLRTVTENITVLHVRWQVVTLKPMPPGSKGERGGSLASFVVVFGMGPSPFLRFASSPTRHQFSFVMSVVEPRVDGKGGSLGFAQAGGHRNCLGISSAETNLI
ncbi:hypothetical protein BCR34DRAFT_123554 [Clohesyomyces aquaticus]|uniref:Uncharacterized protein n=1 Tax=Clohesyomyces aquaticus TaxID=1231657 RepID=A0A1Y1YNT5_9PLEO|nr:hypothetical protein BCR34DRAFT_123554 [Clohesyomyces aquaticus]